MLLQQLKLHNIRSYLDTTINFPENSTLLSGDIGSGKSTILLAIEFALFGVSKTDLPGELLLRKGSVQGSVELSFIINAQEKRQEILIKRNLKKDKDSIKQVNGYIIINNLKKELTPVELKAEIIALLGYPEEFISKSKNYIFRYTVYTPQEEMKFILQENAEERLDVLRKIFNIDKYKTIRENLQFYLKQMRAALAVMEAKTEPLEEHKRQLQELVKEKEKLNILLQELTPKIEQAKTKLQYQQKELEQLELQQNKFQQFQQQYTTKTAILNEKKGQIGTFNVQIEQVSKQIDEFSIPINTTLENTKNEILQLEHQKNAFLSQKSSLQEKLNQVQEYIKELQHQINGSLVEKASFDEKNLLVGQLSKEVAEKDLLDEEKLKLDKQWDEISGTLAKNNLLLMQSKELQQKIISLHKCPTCLQEVCDVYKHNISVQEQQKIENAEKEMLKLQQEKEQLAEKKNIIREELEQIQKKETLLLRAKLELKHLMENKQRLAQKQELLKLKVQENNQLMGALNQLLQKDELDLLSKKITQLQELLHKLSQREYLQYHFNQLTKQLTLISEMVSNLNEEVHSIELELAKQEDLTGKISEQKELVSQANVQEKELSINYAQLITQVNALKRQEQPLQLVIDNLNEQKNKLIRNKELYYWLEEYFLSLTYTLEKQLMVGIHNLFNQLFQEWFSILIDDDNVYSKIDENFTPIIEQNGYEVNFANLSGGEKTSCALAYRLALNRVINDVIHDIKTKDILILDEPTDGFSTEQLDKVREVLERLKLKQIIIVSHESKIEAFVENVVRVSKNGHVSEVAN